MQNNNFTTFLSPIALFLNNHKIKATHIIFINTVLSLVIGFFPHIFGNSFVYWLIIPVFLMVRHTFDHIAINLEQNFSQSTEISILLRELGVIISDAAIIIGFLTFTDFAAATLVLFLVAASTTEMAGITGKAITGVRQYEGPMGNTERNFCLGIISLLIAFQIINFQAFNILISIMAIACVATTLNRVLKTLELCER